MKTKWISIRRLKEHEFETTFRRLHPNNKEVWMQKLELLCEQENRANGQLTKILGQLLIAYLILTSLRTGHDVSITVFQITASVPVAYFLPIVSFLFIVAVIAFNHFTVAMSLRIRHGNRVILPGFSTEVLRQIKGHSDGAFGIPVFLNSFVKEKIPFSSFFGYALVGIILALLIPFLMFGMSILHEQWLIALDSSYKPMERASCAFGAVAISFSFFYAAIFNIPLPTRKNLSAIRWGFLAKLYAHRKHPRAREWRNND